MNVSVISKLDTGYSDEKSEFRPVCFKGRHGDFDTVQLMLIADTLSEELAFQMGFMPI
jgi:hypothetical protein